jgi:hypothetical protein
MEAIAHLEGRGDDGTPRRALAWVEVEDQPVRMLQVIGPRALRMDFDNARLVETDDALHVVERQHRLRFADIDPPHRLAQSRKGMLGEEARLVRSRRAAQQT